MKPLTSREITGNWATLILPIAADERIDFGRLAAELDYLIECGVDGIYSGGTTGEFYAQSEEEFDRINSLLSQRCEAAGMPVQIGASHMSPQLSLDRVRRAARLRPGAIQVILSDWFPLSDQEAIDCLRRFAEAAEPVGLVLYNPPHAKRVLQPADYARLLEAVPELVGIKVVDGDESWYARMRKLSDRLSIFVPGHRLATGFSRGAAGSYSNVACLHPLGAQRWYELIETDIAPALDIQGRLIRFLSEHVLPLRDDQGYSNTALDKLLAAIGAWAEVGTRLRWPYRSITPETARRLRPIAQQMVPELLPG